MFWMMGQSQANLYKALGCDPTLDNGCLPKRSFITHYKRLFTLIDSASSYISISLGIYLDVYFSFQWIFYGEAH